MRPLSLLALAAVLGAPATAFAAKAAADITPPQRRQAIVDTAERLSRRAPAPELPAELASAFNPVGFDQPDPETLKANAAAAAAQRAGAAPVVPAGPTTDREILETLAQRLTPSGTFLIGGKPLLIINRNRFEVGTKFTVTYNETDYELQLVAIDRTTFTLRYHSEEITRPIKPVR